MGQSTVSGVLQLEHYKRSYLKYLPLQDFCKTLTCSDLYRLLVQIKCCFDSICRDRKSLRARRLWLPQMDQYQQSWRRRSRKIRLGKTRYLHVQVCFRNYTNYNKAKGTKIVEWLTSFWECHQSGIWRNKRVPLPSDSSHDSNVTRMIRVVKLICWSCKHIRKNQPIVINNNLFSISRLNNLTSRNASLSRPFCSA